MRSQLQCWFNGRTDGGRSDTGTSSLSRKPSCCKKIPRSLSSGKYRLSIICCQRLRSSSLNFTFTSSAVRRSRSEEHTSELQSREKLVCRLLLEYIYIYISFIIKISNTYI